MAKRYVCTCPDFTKQAKAFPSSSKKSLHFDRDWTDTNAGVNGTTQYCKHIWATMISLGEVKPSDIPQDVPMLPDQGWGESMVGNLGFDGIPGFRGS